MFEQIQMTNSKSKWQNNCKQRRIKASSLLVSWDSESKKTCLDNKGKAQLDQEDKVSIFK